MRFIVGSLIFITLIVVSSFLEAVAGFKPWMLGGALVGTAYVLAKVYGSLWLARWLTCKLISSRHGCRHEGTINESDGQSGPSTGTQMNAPVEPFDLAKGKSPPSSKRLSRGISGSAAFPHSASEPPTVRIAPEHLNFDGTGGNPREREKLTDNDNPAPSRQTLRFFSQALVRKRLASAIAAAWCVTLALTDFDVLWAYQLSRWALSATAIFLAFHSTVMPIRWACGALAVIHNPIAPIDFGEEGWHVVNWLSTGVFAIFAIFPTLRRLKPDVIKKASVRIAGGALALAIPVSLAAVLIYVAGDRIRDFQRTKSAIEMARMEIERREQSRRHEIEELQSIVSGQETTDISYGQCLTRIGNKTDHTPSQKEWRASSLATIDRMALDWDGYLAENPKLNPPTWPDPETAQEKLVVRACIRFVLDGNRPSEMVEPSTYRKHLARMALG